MITKSIYNLGTLKNFLCHNRLPTSISGFARLKAYKTHDILLAPAVHSGWGLTIQEAVAYGLIVVATETSSAACELIINNVNAS